MSGEIGYGTTLAFSDTEDGAYTSVSEITDITMPSMEVNDVDKTHYLSTDYFREFTPGLVNPGEFTFKVLFNKTEQDTLYQLLRTLKWWKVEFPLDEGESVESNWKCQGYLKKLQNMNPLDDKMECEFNIKFTGKPTFNPGT